MDYYAIIRKCLLRMEELCYLKKSHFNIPWLCRLEILSYCLKILSHKIHNLAEERVPVSVLLEVGGPWCSSPACHHPTENLWE